MTDGLAAVDQDAEDKYLREKFFAVEVGERGLQVKLEAAEASEPADRVKILNTIAGRTGKELDAPVMESHDSYQVLNDILAARFAAALLRPLLDADKPLDLCLQRLKKSGLKSLQLNFDKCERFDGAMAGQVFRSMPSVLETLDLKRGGVLGTHCAALGELIAGSATLKSLDLSYNKNIGAEGGVAIAKSLEVNTSLTSLNLFNDRNDGNLGNEGGIAIAKALGVNAVLAEVDLRGNKLGTEGWSAIFSALKENKENKIKAWNLGSQWQGISTKIAQSLTEYVSVSATLTSLDLSSNSPDHRTKERLMKAAKSTLKIKLKF